MLFRSEVAEYLQGGITLCEAKQRMKKKTREFVRRQRNWFKPEDDNIHWFDISETTADEIINKMRIDNKAVK